MIDQVEGNESQREDDHEVNDISMLEAGATRAFKSVEYPICTKVQRDSDYRVEDGIHPKPREVIRNIDGDCVNGSMQANVLGSV